MSWPEVQKINSNFQREPLNYNNYLTDIATYGANSYIMHKQNENAFRDFITNSVALWGYPVAKAYLYNRLTDEDLDFLFEKSGKLGGFFNARLGEDVFAQGHADQVLKTMSVDKFNRLEEKFKEAFKRYISKKTQGEEVGVWLKKVFGIEAFGEKTTIQSVLSDQELWASNVTTNESVMWLLSHSTSAAVFSASSEISMSVYKSFVAELSKNKDKMKFFFKKLVDDNRITNFFENAELCDVVIASAEAMKALVRVAKAFEAFLQSPTAAQKIADNETVKQALFKGLADSVNTEKVLRENKLNNATLKAKMAEIANLVELTDAVEIAKAGANELVSKVDEVNALATKATENVDIMLSAMLNNNPAMQFTMESTEAFGAWISNEVALNNLIKAKIAVDYLFNSEAGRVTFMQAQNIEVQQIKALILHLDRTDSHTTFVQVWNNSALRSKIISTLTAMNAVANSATAMNAVINNTTAMNAVINNTTAMNAVINNTTAMNAVLRSLKALKAISNASDSVLQACRINTKLYENALANTSNVKNSYYYLIYQTLYANKGSINKRYFKGSGNTSDIENSGYDYGFAKGFLENQNEVLSTGNSSYSSSYGYNTFSKNNIGIGRIFAFTNIDESSFNFKNLERNVTGKFSNSQTESNNAKKITPFYHGRGESENFAVELFVFGSCTMSLNYEHDRICAAIYTL